MAESKCDLLVLPSRDDKKIYNQPWYKERLKTKYIKSRKPSETSRFLNGQNWTFIKDGLDDFRDGLPPPVQGSVFLKGSKGLSPNIQGSNTSIEAVKQPAVRKRFSKDEVCFSRVTPQQQQRQDNIEEIEFRLKQHPLALYPHLEECLPPDLFEDVVGILDPEMNVPVDEEEEGDYPDEDSQTDSMTVPTTKLEEASDRHSERESQDGPTRNPYRWLPRKEEKEKKDKKKNADRKPTSPSQDEHIKTVTKEFCDWVAGLGGESNNIEETTITSLFASGYETKPALSVPIHVVELTNVPPELRMSAAIANKPHPLSAAVDEDEKSEWALSGGYSPSWLKFKYGAWYLDPKSWKKRPWDEPLVDPKELKDQEMTEAKKTSNALNKDLAPMHGAKAFNEFADRKGTRKPEFLQQVAAIQEQQAREEQAKIEAELAKQKKYNFRRKSPAPNKTPANKS